MTRYLMVGIAILIGLLYFQSWRLENSQKAEAVADAANGQLQTAIDNMTKSLTAEREANNHAQTIHQQQLGAANKRRQLAESAYNNLSEKAHAWNINIVPADITAGLCITPGSCQLLPATSRASSKLSDGGKGASTSKHYVLNNKALRDGIENLRDSLGKCNAKIKGLAVWVSEIKQPNHSAL